MDWETIQGWWAVLVGWGAGSAIFRVVLIIGLAALGLYGVKAVTRKLYNLLLWRSTDDVEVQKRSKTLTSFIRITATVTIIAMSSMMVLLELGMDIRPILTGAGVVGLAIGFGAQSLVQDIISGIFILLEDQLRVGDVVNLKDKGGLVEKISLRTVQLRSLDGSVHFVRNGQIDVVTNMTKVFSNYVIEIGIAYDANIEQALQIFRDVDEEMRKDEVFKNDILKPLEVYGVERLADSAVVLRARTTTKPLRQWDVGRAFLRRIKERFDAAGIVIPFPQRTMQLPKEVIDALRAAAQRQETTPLTPGRAS